MHCFDCVLESRASTVPASPAVAAAVCARCGAGICGRHAHVTSDPLPGPPISSTPMPEARRLTCELCYEAERAAAGRA
ncbi:DUF2180 domain-containing protein [Streptomyces dengpaensis]|uniref:DUF2180 domain-containing protein n=1 Tax=Streptomyces dengpaensis TaxID=2049881 RepID=A0ABN5ICA9_9ACTN|nr:DUF2180 domain-containing protein [Streptomyces dengpaensis]PIB00363.1 hypothetical protein B1C81_38160 [Streptomyces sp. HG99]